MTMLDTRPEETTTDEDEGDQYAHYFRKADLDRAMFDGVKITALCGHKARPLRGIDGREVCPPCKAKLEEIPQ